jgi:tRNA A37 N6-isopentenylltransferase MiaA
VRERTVLWIGIPALDELKNALQQRVQNRFAHGMLEETSALIEKYSDWLKPAFSATG